MRYFNLVKDTAMTYNRLTKMNILISAGPTREKIDDVRFITNRSTGKMGYALAEAARDAGHRVTLVSGPVSLPPVDGVQMIPIESAAEMAEAILTVADNFDVIIMTAAVADYRPVKAIAGKLKKQPGNLILELERTTDILQTLGRRKRDGQMLVGFAAESERVIEYARGKLTTKNLDWIVANDISRSDAGFAGENNTVTILGKAGQAIELPLESKKNIARDILRHILEQS